MSKNQTPQNSEQLSQSAGQSTQSVHHGRQTNAYHAITDPIVQSSTYTFSNTADLTDFMEARLWGNTKGRYAYGRFSNPTIRAAEKRLSALEGAGDAILFASGMAAISTVLLAMLAVDTHIIITDDCYRHTREFATIFLKRYGIECSVVLMGDYDALEAAIRPNTRVIVSETPTNPYIRLLDLEKLVEIAQRHGVKTMIDSTFATPFNLRPLEWGVDLVVHSATKYLAGHNDLLAGVVAGEAGLISSFRNPLVILGGISNPHDAVLINRGLRTLGLRVEQQNTNAQAIAEFLESHHAIEQVWYPGLRSHPDYELGKKQLSGFGGVLSFTVKGDLETTSQFIDRLNIPIIATSLGGTETLISQPSLMAYYEYSPEERAELGIQDNLVRLAVGIENTNDLIFDIEKALG